MSNPNICGCNCNWIVQGHQGPQGPQGPTGPLGPTGPEGPQGPQGIQGPQGQQGDRGGNASQGPTGPTGPQGQQGPSGPAGQYNLPSCRILAVVLANGVPVSSVQWNPQTDSFFPLAIRNELNGTTPAVALLSGSITLTRIDESTAFLDGNLTLLFTSDEPFNTPISFTVPWPAPYTTPSGITVAHGYASQGSLSQGHLVTNSPTFVGANLNLSGSWLYLDRNGAYDSCGLAF